MNIHVKRILSIILILLIVLGTCYSLNTVFRPVYTDDAVASVRSFSMVTEQTLDVIVYGSSHSWLGIDTHLLNEKYGMKDIITAVCGSQSILWICLLMILS